MPRICTFTLFFLLLLVRTESTAQEDSSASSKHSYLSTSINVGIANDIQKKNHFINRDFLKGPMYYANLQLDFNYKHLLIGINYFRKFDKKTFVYERINLRFGYTYRFKRFHTSIFTDLGIGKFYNEKSIFYNLGARLQIPITKLWMFSITDQIHFLPIGRNGNVETFNAFSLGITKQFLQSESKPINRSDKSILVSLEFGLDVLLWNKRESYATNTIDPVSLIEYQGIRQLPMLKINWSKRNKFEHSISFRMSKKNTSESIHSAHHDKFAHFNSTLAYGFHLIHRVYKDQLYVSTGIGLDNSFVTLRGSSTTNDTDWGGSFKELIIDNNSLYQSILLSSGVVIHLNKRWSLNSSVQFSLTTHYFIANNQNYRSDPLSNLDEVVNIKDQRFVHGWISPSELYNLTTLSPSFQFGLRYTLGK